MQHSFQRAWAAGELSSRYSAENHGALDPPERWPRYRLNPSVRTEPGGIVHTSGIYLPDTDNSCAALLIEGKNTSRAQYLIRYEDPVNEDGRKLYDSPLPVTEWRSTGWTLIERAPGETIPFEAWLGAVDTPPARVPAGEPCPRSGWWHTPARADSRRLFKTGDTFPNIDNSDYGSTFWLWSQDQITPQL
ncbi:hypothetical protein J2W68_001349 [Luteimonas terrae]|uniref:Uncharacterized protein n=1 Tax=Luteimonas terrae TaxID=1530191 RepID=A0ABU1XWL3_9GAMM|nr:hypothetical protein [Luteimonas terrae]